MQWFIVLIVLAIAAFFLIKAFKSRSDNLSSTTSNRGGGPANVSSTGDSAAAGTAASSEQPVDSGGTGIGASTTEQIAAPAATSTGTESTVASSAVVGSAVAVASGQGNAGPADTLAASVVPLTSIDSGDTLHDVREMIKTLNLRSGDASRLSIDKAQFDGVWAGDQNAMSADELASVAARLRAMLA